MFARRLWLSDFRNYYGADFEPAPAGLSVLSGDNGAGKTNVLEALAFLSYRQSFRGAPVDALVRQGAGEAVVRGAFDREGRELVVEVEIAAGGRSRVQVNRHPAGPRRELASTIPVTIFSPADLSLVKGPPEERGRFLDTVLAASDPRLEALIARFERVLRQRNALLRQSGGHLGAEVALSLDVWDTRLVETGTALAAARAHLAEELAPALAQAYAGVAPRAAPIGATYARSWEGPLAAALAAARPEEVRRGQTLVGPQRDEFSLTLGDRPARTHASQGEQ
ncbi:MAG: DNA replication/repair protein RecF, partial [Gemmatimonadales bacterium]